jgi:predicted DNA-binding transcriptional regulator YafY
MTYRPTARVLTVLELLQTYGTLTSRTIAERLEVDPRTVRRYITTLQDLGIPIESQPGADGGYTLVRGHKLPPLMFNHDEVLALGIGLAWVRISGLSGIIGTVESALAKIDRVLPEALSEQLRAVREAIQISDDDYEGYDEFIVEAAVLALCNLAVHKRRQLHILYQSKTDSTERVIDVYAVLNRQQHWYAVGYCHTRNDLRTFRLDRIGSIRLLETTFTPPDSFDANQYLDESIAAIPDRWDIDVVLHTTLEHARKHIPRGLAALTQQGDTLRLRASFHDLDEMALTLVRLGCRVTINQPKQLKTAFTRIAGQIAQMGDDE